MTQEANIQSWKSVFLSCLVLIWLSVMPPSQRGKRKGSPCFQGIITRHTQQRSHKIDFITPSVDVKLAGLNELYFHGLVRYVLIYLK